MSIFLSPQAPAGYFFDSAATRSLASSHRRSAGTRSLRVFEAKYLRKFIRICDSFQILNYILICFPLFDIIIYCLIKRIKAFISYSSKQKVIGGKFKTYFENYCGYETFIAHDDIPGSSIWEDEIIAAIQNSDFFIPLVSQEFRVSPFTDQETGIAVSLNKKIIPIKLDDTNPYGFIEKYQALQYKELPSPYYYKDNINKLVLTIAQIELFKPISSYYNNALDSLVYAFCKSPSFDSTNATIQLICKCSNLTNDHLAEIQKAILVNPQINGGAYGLDSLKECLRNKYGILID